ncbi:hypothetical protein VZT92_003002 [Zoarces viviparus]
MSHSSVSTPSRERGYSYSSGYSTRDGDCSRRDSDHSYQSYRHYSQEKNDVGRHYTERRSYYYSSRKFTDRRSCSRSPIRDRLRRDNGHSRSSSRSPSTKLRPHNSKPGGKRKYKTRHLEETFKNALSEKIVFQRKTSRSVSVEHDNEGD